MCVINIKTILYMLETNVKDIIFARLKLIDERNQNG